MNQVDMCVSGLASRRRAPEMAQRGNEPQTCGRRPSERRWSSVPFSRLHHLPAVLGVLLILCTSSKAQIGTSVCVCSPSMYATITFNFSQNCDNTVVNGDGISSKDCAIAPFQNENVTDLIPISVGSIDIIELDADLVLLTQSSLFGTYGDGDTFSYTSISNDPAQVNATIYPKAIQISAIGNNAGGETLFFAGLIVYVTDCTTFPVILEGSSNGWITFTGLVDAQRAVCPLAPTKSPSATPEPTTAAPAAVSTPTTGTRAPSRSTKVPAPTTRSTKAPAPMRSSKAPSPVRLTIAPTPNLIPETVPPICQPSSSSSSSSSKTKGKKSKKEGGKKGGSKKKGKGSVRGGEESKKKKKGKESYYSHNIFAHDECASRKTPRPQGGSSKVSGKGKGGKGGLDSSDASEKRPSFPPPVTRTTHAPTRDPAAANNNSNDGRAPTVGNSNDGLAPVVVVDNNGMDPTVAPTKESVQVVVVDDQQAADDYDNKRSSTNSNAEQISPSSTNNVNSSSSSSSNNNTSKKSMMESSSNWVAYCMLAIACSVGVASAVYVWRQYRSFPVSGLLTEQEKLTALVKGMNNGPY